MLPAFANRLVFTDHADASYFGMGPYEVKNWFVHAKDGHLCIVIYGRDHLGIPRYREAYDDFLNSDGMTLC